MSNHAYVMPKKMPTVSQIHTDAEAILKKFPQFKLTRNLDEWIVEYIWPEKAENQYFIGLCFWVDRYEKKKCITFRHGHGLNFMWWIEYEIREELAKLYNAVSKDDGYEGKDPPCLERFDSYIEYFRFTRKSMYENQSSKKHFENLLKFEYEHMPEGLKDLYGKP